MDPGESLESSRSCSVTSLASHRFLCQKHADVTPSNLLFHAADRSGSRRFSSLVCECHAEQNADVLSGDCPNAGGTEDQDDASAGPSAIKECQNATEAVSYDFYLSLVLAVEPDTEVTYG